MVGDLTMSADRPEHASESKMVMTEGQSFRMVAKDFGLAGARFQAMRQDKSPES